MLTSIVGECRQDQKLAAFCGRLISALTDLARGATKMDMEQILDENLRGNIYIVQRDKIIYESARGFADLAN